MPSRTHKRHPGISALKISMAMGRLTMRTARLSVILRRILPMGLRSKQDLKGLTLVYLSRAATVTKFITGFSGMISFTPTGHSLHYFVGRVRALQIPSRVPT